MLKPFLPGLLLIGIPTSKLKNIANLPIIIPASELPGKACLSKNTSGVSFNRLKYPQRPIDK